MTEILTAQDIVAAIDTAYEKDTEKRARQYIGASIVGNQCDAYLALSLRGFPNDEPDPQLKRIFQMGHMLEEVVVDDLKRRADIRVWEVDGLTGKQYTYQSWGGHVSCHTDGHIELDDQVVRVLEIKSMNKAKFVKFMEVGVKRSHPTYYAQVQMMMGMSGMTETVFIAICKDNSAYHAEIVKADPIEYAFISSRVERILTGERMPRIASDRLDWRCSGCFKRTTCWEEPVGEPKECAHCEHAAPRQDGAWWCNMHAREADEVCAQFRWYRPEDKSL